MMDLPVRYIPINYQTFRAVIKITVKPMVNTLRIEYSYHDLKQPQLIQTVEKAFLEDPSANNIFNTLPLEMLFKHDISVAQAASLVFYLENKLKDPKDFIPIDLPNLKLYLQKSQIYLIYTFIKSVSEQYEIILSNLKNEGNNKKNEDTKEEEVSNASRSTTSGDVRNDVPVVPSRVDKSLLPEKNGEITDILEEAFSLSPNKIVNFYLTKQIINNSHSCIIEENGNNITIGIIPLIDVELYSYSLSNVSDLNNVINSFDISQDDIIIKIKTACQHLNYIINERQNVKPLLLTAALQVVSFLIYLYRIKLPNTKSDNFENIINGSIQRIMINVFKSQTSILFKFKDYLELDYDEEIKTINSSVEKYNYLLKIDKDEFIDSVLADVKTSKTTEEELELPLINTPTVIDITKYFGTTIDWKNDKRLLAYEVIENPRHKVISQSYNQLLKISQSGTNLAIKNMNLIVSKYYDIITTKIFKEIDNNQELVKTNVSTLLLMKKFIIPFVSKSTSTYTLLFLLYQVVIPHIHNMHGQTQFIDVFH